MIIDTAMGPKAYIDAMKQQMEAHTDFGMERFTGFFLGRMFCVTYHSGYIWNRRINNEKNCAVGFVKKSETGSEVKFLHLRGLLCPPQFLSLFLLITAMLLTVIFPGGLYLHDGWWNVVWCYLVLLVGAPMSALVESMTDRGQEGKSVLLALLLDPEDPLAYLHNKDHV